MNELFSIEEIGPAAPRPKQPKGTPALPGTGPKWKTCRDCAHFRRVQHHDYTYLKCGAVESAWTHGAATDIRASWPACREFEDGGSRMSGTIGAIAPWFGSKRTLAPLIVEEFGPHRAYWEPFCGSLAILFEKLSSTMETVNDLNGDLVNLARVVQDDALSVKLFDRLYRVTCSEAQHREAAERWKAQGKLPAGAEPDLERAVDYFICSWNGRNGVAGTANYNQGFCRRFTKNGGHAAKRFASAVESIPDWWDRLRGVTILSADAFTLIPKIEDAKGVVIYCDPPYIEKGAKYLHDFTGGDHARLAEQLGRFEETRVVVSYYDHPRLAELYPATRWTKIPLKATKALVNQGMRDKEGAVAAPEVLLVNRRYGAPEYS